jgi:GT2 family glycosyltransferase
MLKDSGRLAEAETNYRLAVSDRPYDADTYLQLGHALKLQGKRAAAWQAYRRAAKLAPRWLEPKRELSQLDDRSAQEALFEDRLRSGAVDELVILTRSLLDMRKSLDTLAEALPNIQSQIAFPVSCYDTFRARYDVPPAPRLPAGYSFGVLLLVDRESLETLYAQVEAVRSQTLGRWQLHMIGTDPARKRAVERAAAADRRIQWMPGLSGEGLAESERRVALSVDAEWILLLSTGALLHPRALEWFAAAAGHTPAVAFITDEETSTRRSRFATPSSAEFRQAVDYETLLEMNTCGETLAVAFASYRSVAPSLVTTSVAASRSSLLLALARDGQIGHIPCTLVCRDGEEIVDHETVAGAHEEAVRAHLQHNSLDRQVQIGARSGPLPRLPVIWQPHDPSKSIAIVIPTKDNGFDVALFIDSLRAKASAPNNFCAIIIDNGSTQEETRRILAKLAKKWYVRVHRIDEPFNWSRLNNRAVDSIDSPLLIFANDDMLMLSEEWDKRIRGLLERQEIGAVGARLLYEDDIVQHAGVIFGWDGSVIHDGLYQSDLEPGPASRWQVSRAVGAVTGAFLATRRDLFLAHHGFDEARLAVSYGDIDYGLKLRASGLKVLWTPDITLYHHESKTRGLDHFDSEKRARDAVERAVMEARWGATLRTDPSINPIWNLETFGLSGQRLLRQTLPFRLLSAPSQSRLWRHIERCARSNPWLPERSESRLFHRT